MNRRIRHLLPLLIPVIAAVLLTSCSPDGGKQADIELMMADLATLPVLEIDYEMSGGSTLRDFEVEFYDYSSYRGERGERLATLSADEVKFSDFQVDGFGVPRRLKMRAENLEIEAGSDMMYSLQREFGPLSGLLVDLFKARKTYEVDFEHGDSAVRFKRVRFTAEDMLEVDWSLELENVRYTGLLALFYHADQGRFRGDARDLSLPRLADLSVSVRIMGDLREELEDLIGDAEDELEGIVEEMRDEDLDELADALESFIENPDGFAVSMSMDEVMTLGEILEVGEMDGPDEFVEFLRDVMHLKLES